MAAAPAHGLTPEQVRSWDENGYLIIPDALDQATVEGLLKEAHGLLEGEFPVGERGMMECGGEMGRGSFMGREGREIYGRGVAEGVSVRELKDEKSGTRALVMGGEASRIIFMEVPELPELRSAAMRTGANLL